MKKILFVAALAMLGLQSQAQLVTSTSSMKTTQVNVIETPKNGWSTFGIEYLPSSLSPKHGDSQSFTGLALTWTKARSLTSSLPLFLEVGIGAQYSFYSETTGSGKYETETNWSMISAKIPVNIIYSYQIPNTSINIDPYIGLRFRGNIYGEVEQETNGNSDTYNLFDEDDMGSDDRTYNRFQLGWQIGVKARLNNTIFVGIAYGSDFGDIVKDVTINETQLSIGFVF